MLDINVLTVHIFICLSVSTAKPFNCLDKKPLLTYKVAINMYIHRHTHIHAPYGNPLKSTHVHQH